MQCHQSVVGGLTHRAADLPASSQEPEVTAKCADPVGILKHATVASTGAPKTLMEERMDERQPTLFVATQ